MGFTSFDHFQPGWKVARPTTPPPILTSSICPFVNLRTSSGEFGFFFLTPALVRSLPICALRVIRSLRPWQVTVKRLRPAPMPHHGEMVPVSNRRSKQRLRMLTIRSCRERTKSNDPYRQPPPHHRD